MKLAKFLLLTALFSNASVTALAQSEVTISEPTENALLHVLAHEIGHAILREFDLPIIGPEEDIADDFATIYIYMTFPDRAADIIRARALQNMADGTQQGMFSEYRNDDQRAGRSVCLLYGQDPERFSDLAAEFGLEGDEAEACQDFAPEVGRSWRRILDNYRMPSDARVTEVGLSVAESPYAQALANSAFRNDTYTLVSAIDWHSRVTVSLEECDGSSFWSRNGRRMTICSGYIARFEQQLSGIE